MLKTCRKCKCEKDSELFCKHKGCKDGINTICKACHYEYIKSQRAAGKRNTTEESRKYYEKYPEKKIAASASYKERHPERVKESQAKYRAKNAGKERERREIYRKANPELFKLYGTIAKGNRRKRIVGFDKELTDFVIKEAHHLRLLRNNVTGIEWHVDHIIPLQGKLVSGLHVWNNLQVIPAKVNILKSNHPMPESEKQLAGY